MNTYFTKGEWSISFVGDYTYIDSHTGLTIAEVFDMEGSPHNANLIAASPDMYAMVESLSHELNMAIDEINTMRDIHHTDNLTPADHWDKESLHDAQVLLAKARGEIT